jgi:23S rRNA (cytidine1920-2'-O)/16S rRNA (cytidine1409-2'-O)-methyltransferase
LSDRDRLDKVLVERGFYPSREKAHAAIMAGDVTVDGQKETKAGTLVRPDASIEIKAPMPYVSRGGFKLEKAIGELNFSPAGKVLLDIGASTGGFTDCALKHGAKHVFAVDVGYGQLDWSLRQDARVTVMERQNARYLEPDMFNLPLDACTIDASFISIRLLIPKVAELLFEPGKELVSLIKPQFEAGREKVGKKGVVRDPAVHLEVLNTAFASAAKEGFVPIGVTFSPITGPEGNIEFLGYWKRATTGETLPEEQLKRVVTAAHAALS